jgi:hypothetical protein
MPSGTSTAESQRIQVQGSSALQEMLDQKLADDNDLEIPAFFRKKKK